MSVLNRLLLLALLVGATQPSNALATEATIKNLNQGVSVGTSGDLNLHPGHYPGYPPHRHRPYPPPYPHPRPYPPPPRGATFVQVRTRVSSVTA